MLEFISFTSIIIITLSIFQTIIGVGILVLGTPILLLIGYEMLEIMNILLPLSILNSLINIFYLKKRFNNISIDNKIKNYFFSMFAWNIFRSICFKII